MTGPVPPFPPRPAPEPAAPPPQQPPVQQPPVQQPSPGQHAQPPPVQAPAPPPTAAQLPPAFASNPAPPPSSARPTRPAGQPAPSITPKRTRRATLVLSRVDPWSTLKASFVYSCALVIVLVVAVVALYALLSGMGVFTSVDGVLAKTAPGKHIGFPLSSVVLVSLVVGIVDIVLLTALSTLGAFVYNLVADLVGGVEVTLSERD